MGWQALATELRQLGCWEAAAQMLARTLSRPAHAPSVWLDMALCQEALGRTALAMDCLYHLLHEDPWSAEADAARQMLADMGEEAPAPSRRAELLNQRVMTAWQRGEAKLALIGNREDYALELEKGLGSITVDGKTVTDFGSSGSGEHRLKIEGGVGAVHLRFLTEP